ncbi:patatin-like phospholipase family protein [Zooshikella sp. RANM57]|uniref:patatin-like phospholipase family protein n=1 Tax=Zooshikella sp. RANM57 TaxID=3425863 RepID=UPI003D6F935C
MEAITKGLSLEGGGAKGRSYGTALKHLDLNQYTVVGGSSAGAITAVLVASRLSNDEIERAAKIPMKTLVTRETFKRYNKRTAASAVLWASERATESDTQKVRQQIGKLVQPALERLSEFLNDEIMELTSDDDVEKARDLIPVSALVHKAAKNPVDDYTFGVIRKARLVMGKYYNEKDSPKDLLITATALKPTRAALIAKECGLRVFSSKKAEDDHVPIPKAAAASGAFPGVFSPVWIDHVPYIDGGVMNNDPSDEVLKVTTGTVTSLRLNRIKKLKNRTNAAIGIATRHLKHKALRSTEGRYTLSKKLMKKTHKNKIRSTKAQKERLIEMDVQPQKIDTLWMDPEDNEAKQADVSVMNKMRRYQQTIVERKL